MPLTRRSIIHSTVAFAATAALARNPSAIAAGQPKGTPEVDTSTYETITIGDREVAYRSTGSGEPLVLIQGLGGSMDEWDPTFLEALGETFQVIAFDNRGMGYNPSSDPYRFLQLGVDTGDLITALGFESAHVFGWSLGAAIALSMTLRRPQYVRTLILHAGGPGGGEGISPPDEAIELITATGLSQSEQRDRRARLLFPDDWIAANPERVEEILDRETQPSSAQGILNQGRALLEYSRLQTPLSEVERPTLIVQGNDDVIVPVGNADVLAAGIVGSWLVEVPGGHGLHYQIPQAMADVVASFTRQADRDQGA